MSGNSLYVIRFDQRLHKVGYSADPVARLAQIACVEGGRPAIVRTWFRPLGDAEVIERQAHRLLVDWRAWGERFNVGAAAACAAVELAIALVSDTQALAPEGLPQVACSAINDAVSLPSVDNRIGYVAFDPEIDPAMAMTALRQAGVGVNGIYFDRPGDGRPSLLAAVKAARDGDEVFVFPGQIRSEDADSFSRKGATIRVLV